MLEKILGLFKEEEGQGMAEYALILALVAVVVIAGLTFLGTAVRDRMNTVGHNVAGN